MLMVLSLWLLVARGREATSQAHDPGETWRNDHDLLQKALDEGPPVVSASLLPVMEGDYYLPQALSSHLFCVTADAGSAAYNPYTAFNDFEAVRTSRRFPLHVRVAPWRAFSAAGSPFYLYTDIQPQWWFDVLPREGWHLTLRAVAHDRALFYVEKSPGTQQAYTPQQ
jgi:hypothetical protein